MTPLVKELASLDEDVAISCTWFDMGTLRRFEFRWSEIPGSRLPFDRCAIVGRDGRGDKFLVVAEQVEDSTILLASWALKPSTFTRTPLFAVLMSEGEGGCRIANVDGEDEITKDHAAPIVGILAEFLKSANPAGYRAASNPRSITNKRRAKNGKPPLIYDWHTVTIESAKPKGEDHGGTHASPRQHERRGHWRTLASGIKVWVRHCTVGDASRGAVFKDYKTGGSLGPCAA
jgi:hypothetical protein